MKKIIASLLISFISCSLYAQDIFAIDYNSKKEPIDTEEQEWLEQDDGNEYDYARENGINKDDEKLIKEIERQNSLLEDEYDFKFFQMLLKKMFIYIELTAKLLMKRMILSVLIFYTIH